MRGQVAGARGWARLAARHSEARRGCGVAPQYPVGARRHPRLDSPCLAGPRPAAHALTVKLFAGRRRVVTTPCSPRAVEEEEEEKESLIKDLERLPARGAGSPAGARRSGVSCACVNAILEV